MKQHISIRKIVIIISILPLFTVDLAAQKILQSIVRRDAGGELRIIQVAFDDTIGAADILDKNIISLDEAKVLSTGAIVSKNPPLDTIYEMNLSDGPLAAKISPAGKSILNDYILNIKIKNSAGRISWQTFKIILPDPATAATAVVASESKSIEDSEVYIDGDMRGSRNKKISFSTNIKLKRLQQTGAWIHSGPWPFFFKLKASTNPEADPDSMEIGYSFGRIIKKHYFWDNEAKIESERDFQNTNLIYSTRGIFRPAGVSITRNKEGDTTSLLFFRPYIGMEFGKNLHSPLAAAEGDGIARPLAGTDLRLNVPINEEKGQEINWETSYTRRWLLTDELGFKANSSGTLQLIRFGKSPRDYFRSSANFSLNKFTGIFVEYDWGQLPPSYKMVDHRFRLGFFYRFKYSVK